MIPASTAIGDHQFAATESEDGHEELATVDLDRTEGPRLRPWRCGLLHPVACQFDFVDAELLVAGQQRERQSRVFAPQRQAKLLGNPLRLIEEPRIDGLETE